MKYFSRIIIFSWFLLLMGCRVSDAKQVVTLKGKFELKLPANFKKLTDLNNEASLQYGNSFTEFYTIVIEESNAELFGLASEEMKQGETVETFFETISLEHYKAGFQESLPHLQLSQKDYMPTTIGGFPAYHIEKEVITEDVKFFFSIGFLKGKRAFYQVATWTLASQKEKHRQAMNDIIHSFKEL